MIIYYQYYYNYYYNYYYYYYYYYYYHTILIDKKTYRWATTRGSNQGFRIQFFL